MEKGTVIEKNNDKITVSFKRGAGCGSCKACSEGQNENEMIITAYNDCDANIGDVVEVNIETAFMLKATIIMYVIPLITMMVGFLIGNIISEEASFFLGLIFLAVTYGVIKMNESKFQNRDFTAKATKIVIE